MRRPETVFGVRPDRRLADRPGLQPLGERDIVRIWGRVALGGIAVLTSSFVITIPAGAAQSHPGGVSDTCPEVLAGAPTGGSRR